MNCQNFKNKKIIQVFFQSGILSKHKFSATKGALFHCLRHIMSRWSWFSQIILIRLLSYKALCSHIILFLWDNCTSWNGWIMYRVHVWLLLSKIICSISISSSNVWIFQLLCAFNSSLNFQCFFFLLNLTMFSKWYNDWKMLEIIFCDYYLNVFDNHILGQILYF